MTDLTAERLLAAYAQGVFPMAGSAEDSRLYWFDPPERGVLPVGGVHVSRSMRHCLRHCGWNATINRDFLGVVEGCADRTETWINGPLIDLYQRLFHMGHAHSMEIYDGETLIGGSYGISLGAAFFGESMFSRRPNASKVALICMSWQLSKAGFVLWDTQYLTPHLAAMGGSAISRYNYRRKLTDAIRQPADFTAPVLPDLQLLLQDMTQTS